VRHFSTVLPTLSCLPLDHWGRQDGMIQRYLNRIEQVSSSIYDTKSVYPPPPLLQKKSKEQREKSKEKREKSKEQSE
jgi:hypothetical protein